VDFVTLCEAYIGIEPHFNLWNYFHAWLWQGLGVEAIILGGMYIFVRSGHGVDPYFHLPSSSPLDGWQKVWFFLRNDFDVLLTVFTSSCSSPNRTGCTVWSGQTYTGCNPCVRLFNCYDTEG
jgi:hypothetical protein